MGCRNCLKYNGKACELGLSFPCGEYVPHIINPFDKQGDLISRSALLKRVESVNGIIVAGPFGDGIEFGIDTAKEWIIEAPSVDAVEVVRCRECKWFKPYQKPVEDFDGRCVVHMCETDEEEYCSTGRVKDNGTK